MTVRILIGDVREQLRQLPADFFDCVVTSPPYWGLRDYGIAGQLGLECSLGEHLDVMVDVFNEVRRVMKPTATLWLNYGDCYATSPNGRSAVDTKAAGNDDRTFRDKPFSTVGGVLKPKDLCMVPSRIAIALQEAGWWIRSHIIWHKPNPMPESVRDRPTNSHESIFLLTKSERYYFDAEAVREKSERPEWMFEAPTNPGNADRKDGGCTQRKTDKQRGHGRHHDGFNDRWDSLSKEEQSANGRNIRNVWTVATHPFAEAHFATFPPDLIEPCIKAGCPEKCCGTCGLPWTRETERTSIAMRPNSDSIRGNSPSNRVSGSPQRGSVASRIKSVGWAPSCKCGGPVVPGMVLDPFGGAGTTGLVADRLQRHATLIELNPEYAAIAERRIRGDAPLFAEAIA